MYFFRGAVWETVKPHLLGHILEMGHWGLGTGF
jgi:hypothetical protein